MRFANIKSFNTKIMVVLISVVLLIALFLGSAQYLLIAHNYDVQDQQRRELLESNIIHLISATDYMNRLIELPIEKESKHVLEAISDHYDTYGLAKIDLDAFYDADSELDLYIIDKNDTIIDATYTADIGLDLSQFDGVSEFLASIRTSGVFSTDRMSLSSLENIITKYSYLPSSDGQYIFETSKRLERDETIPNALSFDNFGEELAQNHNFVKRILVYNNYGVAFQVGVEEPLTVDANYHARFNEALESMNTVSFSSFFEGEEVTVKFLPYQVIGANEIHSKTVVEVIYTDADLVVARSENLMLIIITGLIGAVLVSIYAVYRSSTLLSPLNQLNQGVSKVALGNFDVVITLDTNDEFARFASHFNDMTQRVKVLMQQQVEKEQEIMSQKEEIEALYEETSAMNTSLYDMIEANKQSYFETIKALANAEEEKDSYTRGHCDRVMNYALRIGEAMQLSAEELDIIRFGGILHDIGKIGVPEHILNKESPLTEAEFSLIRQHPSIGERILRDLTFMKDSIRIVYEHHEWYNGNGYPRALIGDEIYLLARIVCIADAYDAMTTQRPYRKQAMSHDEAIVELQVESGTQFDPNIVDVFVNILTEE